MQRVARTRQQELMRPGASAVSPAVRPGQKPSVITERGSRPSEAQSEKGQRFTDVRSENQQAGPAFVDLNFGAPPKDFEWEIDRIVIGSPNGTYTKAYVLVGEFDPDNIYTAVRDRSFHPSEDVSDENSAVFVPENAALRIRFVGGAAGDIATANIQGFIRAKKAA